MFNDAKVAAGRKAAQLIQDGMVVGLGSGSTAECFIDSLIQRCQKGLKVQAVSSSRASTDRAKKGGIEVLDINTVKRIDVTVDGADEIDAKKRMIKGGGGAHLREKILAAASQEMVVVVDESKVVASIGTKKLPIEVVFFGSVATKKKIEKLGYPAHWRLNADETLFITENGNLLLDLHFPSPPKNPEEMDAELHHIPGVVETGFFFHMAGRVIVGYNDGDIKIL